ncbi:MAG: NADPH-dependent 7-cyano-7-deazaguanine reductase QueF, partial [Deltaproteobacteria bacterium]|nr:NADPH-dependent 7-cyano-7-deazaguanine reductase QueF [Deltaproteobacteria bacterium]
RQRVCYELKEFAAVCPFSGLPDTGTVLVEYIPRQKLVELKSLKYYFISFRNVGIFQEAVSARIFKDLFKLLDPEWLQIRTIYATRGGIDTTCTVDSKDQDSA